MRKNALHFADGETSLVFSCAVRFFLGAILAGGQIFGVCAPFGVGFVAAAGSGMNGLAALLGLLVGSMLLMDLTSALRYVAIGVLIYSVSVAFNDTRVYSRAAFMPTVAAGSTAAVGIIYLLSSTPGINDCAYFAVEVALAALCAFCARIVFERYDDAEDGIFAGCLGALAIFVFISASQIPFTPYMSLGRILTSALVLYFLRRYGDSAGAAAGIGGGFAMDIAAMTDVGGIFYCAAYGAGAVAAGFGIRRSPLVGALLFIGGASLPFVFADISYIWSLPETIIGAVIFMFVPKAMFLTDEKDEKKQPRTHRIKEEESAAPTALRDKLLAAAEAFRTLYEDLSRSAPAPNDERIATVYDRAADAVCRHCAIRGMCWEKDYVSTYNALNDASDKLKNRGKMVAADLPKHFTSRCINIKDFLAAINAEFSAMLLRRRYLQQIEDTRSRAKLQYAQISELLTAAAQDEPAVTASADNTACRVGAFSEPKQGESVSGDTLASFETADRLYLLLSDGMGCGEEARRESAMTVRLMEKFLKSGIEPETALKTLNAAMTLHLDESGSFTTVDLMSYRAFDGRTVLYKYGAAPTYIRSGGKVRRICSEALPAGFESDSRGCEKTELHLAQGDCAVLISDGTADVSDDLWLRDIIEKSTGADAKQLAARIVAESRAHSGRQDDGSALVLCIDDGVKEV